MNKCPECGSSVSVADRFCGMCGSPLGESRNKTMPQNSRRRGVVFTDTGALASKLGVSCESVRNSLNEYIDKVSQKTVYELLDFCEYSGIPNLSYSRLPVQNKNKDWNVYHKILYNKYYYRLSDDVGFLFIIGGDDIIPTPTLRNFVPGTDTNVPADIIYGYYDAIFKSVDINTIFNEPVRYYVGRLPLGDDATFSQFQNYLERSAQAMEKGIPVQMAYAQCDPNWKSVSAEVISDLSHKELIPDIKVHPRFIWNNIFLSPFVTTNNISEAFNDYANLYYFNLHGSSSPDIPNFIGFPANNEEQKKPYMAIAPETFEASHLANIVVTEACYGGKYKNLSTEASILLTSIHNTTLLYLGSSITAYGAIDRIYQQSSQLYGADIMAKEFISGLCDGNTAGEALHIARKTLFGIPVGEYKFVNMLTVLEFSLYGDPSLSAVFPGRKEQHKKQVQAELSSGSIPVTMQVEVIYKETENSILSMVRNRINHELQDLNSRIQGELAKFGIRPRKLVSALRVRYGNESHKMLYYQTECGENPVIVVNEKSGRKAILIPKTHDESLRLSVNYRNLFRDACQRFGLIEFEGDDDRIEINSPYLQYNTVVIDKRIENKSKIQVKTFNAVLDTVYRPAMENCDIAVLACKSCDYDFSLLINPLSIFFETELKLSIIRYFEEKHVDLPKDLTLGSILYCMEENKALLAECGISNEFISILEKLKIRRNRASHTGGTAEKDFLAFYENFIKAVTSASFTKMMDLKINYKQ